jgi:hypothetical protein
MFIIEREDLINWSQGNIMLRDENRCIAVDETRCEEAERRLLKGEKIGLTINNELISTMQLVDGGYKEELI